MSPLPTKEDCDALGLIALPAEAALLHDRAHAPPRLRAHHSLVHDVAHRLIAMLAERLPPLPFDADLVRFGAATHDLGKALVPEELSHPGSRHEALGYEWMLAQGLPHRLARFAMTHASWDGTVALEDLLVAAADKIWKGSRVDALEMRLTDAIAAAAGLGRWQAFAALDGAFDVLADDAATRLAWQARFAIQARPE